MNKFYQEIENRAVIIVLGLSYLIVGIISPRLATKAQIKFSTLIMQNKKYQADSLIVDLKINEYSVS